MAGFDDCPQQARHTDAVRSHMHRHLRAGGLGKERAGHRASEFGHVVGSHVYAQQVVALVGVDTHAVVRGPGLEDLVGPYGEQNGS